MVTHPVARALSVSVLRRSGNTFTPIGSRDAVAPGEAIRLQSAGGLDFGFVKFLVNDPAGVEIFNVEVFASQFGVAWVDTAAPEIEGTYTLLAQAQSVPFLGITHKQSITFVVNAKAPPPISPPPGGDFFGSLKDTAKWLAIGVVVVGAVVVVSKFKK